MKLLLMTILNMRAISFELLVTSVCQTTTVTFPTSFKTEILYWKETSKILEEFQPLTDSYSYLDAVDGTEVDIKLD